MIVAAIDPGTTKTGFAWIQRKNGLLRRSVSSIISREPFPDRYSFMERRIEIALRALPEPPAMVGIEKNHVLEMWKSPGEFTREELLNQVHLEGVYALACTTVRRLFPDVPINTLPTQVWRGYGDKIDTLGKMHEKYGLIFDNDDEADALGIADYIVSYVLPNEAARPKAPTVPQSGQIKLVDPPQEPLPPAQ